MAEGLGKCPNKLSEKSKDLNGKPKDLSEQPKVMGQQVSSTKF